MESGVICELGVCGRRVATLYKSTCFFRVKKGWLGKRRV